MWGDGFLSDRNCSLTGAHPGERRGPEPQSAGHAALDPGFRRDERHKNIGKRAFILPRFTGEVAAKRSEGACRIDRPNRIIPENAKRLSGPQ